jgi:C4-type Zn-finger protein
MTNEEMQRTMEFIVQQQAQFSVDIQELREAQVRGEERVTRMEGVILRLVDVVEKVVEVQARTDQKLVEVDERLSQKLAETDERLNTLITVVERYISEGRNGGSPG